MPPDRLGTPVALLSVGQRRRLGLAVAIAAAPDLLLLDEPTNHLSLALAGEIEEALQTTAGTVVVASHDRWLRRRWAGGRAAAQRSRVSPSHVARAEISASTARGHRRGERRVLVDRVDEEPAGLAVGGGVELPDQPVAVQDRQGEVAPAPLRGGLVHLQDVLELEEVLHAHAVADHRVERRQQGGAPVERQPDLGGVDPPLTVGALDHGRLTGLADVDRPAGQDRPLRPGQPEPSQERGVTQAARPSRAARPATPAG